MTTIIPDVATATDNSVAVVDGQGLSIKVVRGQLEIVDQPEGNGEKRTRKYPKAGRGGLRRIIVIGDSGLITLDAMQWCSWVGVPISIYRPDGELLSTTNYAPTLRTTGNTPDDARLRRAQAIAGNGIVGRLIRHRVVAKRADGSASIVERWGETELAEYLRETGKVVREARTVKECQAIEGEAAKRYFAAWVADSRVTIRFADQDRDRVPGHWRTFTGRATLATNRRSARNATDPINAILNYLYSIAASECRLAALAMGLDPGMGFLHNDLPGRDSLVYDLLEAVRPVVEQWVLHLLSHHVFRRDDFEETRIGSVWIRSPLSHTLAKTVPLWARTIAPFAEQITHMIAKSSPYPIPCTTPLTATIQRQSRNRRPYLGPTDQDFIGLMPQPRCMVCGTENCTTTHRAA